MNREHVSTAELVGRLGKPPELQYTQEQTPYVRLAVATAERFTDRGGEIRERTEWHNAVAWGQVAEDIARDFSKGDSVALTGSLRINSYEKDGLKNRVTELHVDKAEKNLDHTLSKNDARLVGVVREEPKTRSLENGTAMTMLSIATNTTVTGKGGTSREREDWHNVTLWGKTAEAARDIHAGDSIAVDGTLRHRAVPGDEGRERRVSSIDCQKFQVLERAQAREHKMREPTPPAPEPEKSAATESSRKSRSRKGAERDM